MYFPLLHAGPYKDEQPIYTEALMISFNRAVTPHNLLDYFSIRQKNLGM